MPSFKIVLTKNQWKRLADILANIGLLITGTVVIPFLANFQNPFSAIWGIVMASILWYISIYISRRY